MELQELSKRMMRGFVSLTARRVVLLALNFATINLFLARILPVSIIGVFNIANSVLAFFTFFSDIGLAAAVIQKREVKETDLKTTFTIQEALALLITLSIWITAPIFANLYNLDQNGMWLIRALAIGFLLTSLKVVPSVILERELKFQPLVWVEITEALIFNLGLAGLVLSGKQVEAFSLAVLARSFIGVGMIYLIAPWKISLGISREALKPLLSFGIPFQLNSLLALLKDRLVPLVIAQIVGTIGVGYISWAQGLAFLPLEVMNIIIRVTFPAYSRLQDDTQILKVTIERSLFLTTFFVYPLLFGLMAIFPSLITHVVSPKWQPAAPLFYLFCLNTFWATLSTTFTNVLNATGKITTTLKLMVMWTVLTWLLSPILTLYLGFIGVAIASAVISFTSIIPIIIIRRMLNVDILSQVKKPFLGSLLISLVAFWLTKYLVSNFLSLIFVIIFSGLLYMFLMYFFAKDKLVGSLGQIRHVPS